VRRRVAAFAVVLVVAGLAGCSKAASPPPSTSTTTTPATSTTTTTVTPAAGPSVPLVSSTPPPGAVTIPVGGDAAEIVRSAPAGTSFVITTGVHADFDVTPLSGDHFYGQAGAVLDGGHAVVSAFGVASRALGNDVWIVGASPTAQLVIQNYGSNPLSQTGAIAASTSGSPGLHSSGWQVQWVTVTGDASRGISLGDSMVVVACTVTANGRLGIGGGGSGITIADNVITANGVGAAKTGFEAGGIKTVGSDVTVLANQITGNGAPGVWTDGGATNVTLQANTIAGNTLGVQIEISQQVTVQQNAIDGSTQQGVLVVASHDVSVTANSLNGNGGGVLIGGVNRTGPGGITLGAVTVSANTVTGPGVTGLHQVAPPDTVQFSGNHYTGTKLQWQGKSTTFAQWQALGQDPTGTWTP
jgi:Right handed beta helix region